MNLLKWRQGRREEKGRTSEASTFLEQGQIGRLKTWKDNASPPLVKIVTLYKKNVQMFFVTEYERNTEK